MGEGRKKERKGRWGMNGYKRVGGRGGSRSSNYEGV
jgi:hypothetical protein